MLIFCTYKALSGLTVVHSRQPSQKTKYHNHTSLTLGAVLTGKRTLHLRKRKFEVSKGCVFYFMPNEAHACEHSDTCEYISISIPPSLLDEFNIALPSNGNGTPFLNSSELFQLVVQFYDFIQHDPSHEASSEHIRTLLLRLKDEIAPDTTSTTIPARIALAAKFIEANYAEEIHLETLAQVANLSPFHFNRQFSKSYGMPPHDFQNQVRIHKAKQQILTGMSLADVAADCGFTDQSHMTRIFQKFLGIPPGQYAEAFKAV